MADDTQYQIVGTGNGVCETLPVSSKFANRLMRGSQNNPNMYVTVQQATTLRKYVPTTKWGKNERTVYIIAQKYIDKTGTAPTARQIAAISSAGRATDAEGNPIGGLTVENVRRALNKLQKRGVVFTTA